jgi:hypothetical protein
MMFSLRARIGAGVALFVVVLYILTSLSYVAPAGAFKSATSGLASLGRPYFSQAWNVFAPNILKTNIELHISAQWLDESGEPVHSPWFSATDLETAAVANWPLPSRTVKQSWNLIRAYNSRFSELNSEQQLRVTDTFIERTDDGFGAIPEDELIAELTELGDSRGDVVRLLRYDYMLKEYATYLATAYFGEEIIRVRWRLAYDRPNSFENRHSEDREFEKDAETFGWRYVTDDITRAALEAYIRTVERGGGGYDG